MAKKGAGAAAVREAEAIERDGSAEAGTDIEGLPSSAEISSPDYVVGTLQLPLAREPRGYLHRHVELQFGGPAGAQRAETMNRLFLATEGKRLQSGGFVVSPAQSLYWLLDQLAAGEAAT